MRETAKSRRGGWGGMGEKRIVANISTREEERKVKDN